MDAASRSPSESPRLKVALILDADAQVGAALSSVLASEGWSVVHAPDNPSVLKLVEGRAFDLVITGPETNGKEDVDLLRRIRRVRPHIRLIILTGENAPTDVIMAMREGAFCYFSKPFEIASLAEIVRSATTVPPWDDGIELVSATPDWISIIARCDQQTAERLIQFFREMTELPDPEREDVATAFREMLINAIEHGGNFDPSQYVEVSYVRTRKVGYVQDQRSWPGILNRRSSPCSTILPTTRSVTFLFERPRVYDPAAMVSCWLSIWWMS